MKRSFCAKLHNTARNVIYAAIVATFASCSIYTPSSSCGTSSWKSVAAFTALAASDALITLSALYISYSCNNEQPFEPCHTWKRMLLPAGLAAAGATTATVGYYTVEKLKSWSANHSAQTTQTTKQHTTNENV